MTDLIVQFGVLGVFLLMVPESAGIPIPSELTLLFSGFAVSRGWMSFPLAILAATAGNVTGSLLAYALGASGALSRVPGARGVLDRWGRLLDHHGRRAILIARLLPLARTFVSFPAGARRVPLGPFVVLTSIGCALWATAFVLAGLLAGSAWATIDGVAGVAGRLLLAAGLLALAASLLYGRRSRQARGSATRRGEVPGRGARGRDGMSGAASR